MRVFFMCVFFTAQRLSCIRSLASNIICCRWSIISHTKTSLPLLPSCSRCVQHYAVHTNITPEQFSTTIGIVCRTHITSPLDETTSASLTSSVTSSSAPFLHFTTFQHSNAVPRLVGMFSLHSRALYYVKSTHAREYLTGRRTCGSTHSRIYRHTSSVQHPPTSTIRARMHERMAACLTCVCAHGMHHAVVLFSSP